MSNLDKVAKAGLNLNEMSAEEKQVVESLSPEEVDTLLKARSKYEAVTAGKKNVTALKFL